MHPENGQVTARTGSGLCTEVTANGYSMVVDEPAAFGGTGAGPTPYDYLLAALAGKLLVIHAADLPRLQPREPTTKPTTHEAPISLPHSREFSRSSSRASRYSSSTSNTFVLVR